MQAEEIFKLIPLVDQKVADITAFTNVIVPVGVDGLSVNEVIALCNQIE